MDSKSLAARTGATPGKLVLIGVLAVALIGVILAQTSDSKATSDPPVTTDRAARSGRRGRAIQPPTAEQEEPAPLARSAAASQPWPKIARAEVASYDPFARPAWMPQLQSAPPEAAVAENPQANARQAARQAALLELSQQGVSAIVVSGQDRMATIGTQDVRVGDRVQGFRVTEISRQGVVLVDE